MLLAGNWLITAILVPLRMVDETEVRLRRRVMRRERAVIAHRCGVLAK